MILLSNFAFSGEPNGNCYYTPWIHGPSAQIGLSGTEWYKNHSIAITKSQTFIAINKMDPDRYLCGNDDVLAGGILVWDDVNCRWRLTQKQLDGSFATVATGQGDSFTYTFPDWPTNIDSNYNPVDRHFELSLFVSDAAKFGPGSDDDIEGEYLEWYREGGTLWGRSASILISVVVPDNENNSQFNKVTCPYGNMPPDNTIGEGDRYLVQVTHSSGIHVDSFDGLFVSEDVDEIWTNCGNPPTRQNAPPQPIGGGGYYFDVLAWCAAVDDPANWDCWLILEQVMMIGPANCAYILNSLMFNTDLYTQHYVETFRSGW